jgi:ribonuclease Z
MERVVILGSASAVPDVGSENTHILVETGSRKILVDSPGSPMVRLQQVGVAAKDLTDIILTHFHPDHVSGFAPLLMGMWLVGRKAAINVYGLPVTVDRAKQMMNIYDWKDWPNFYPVNFVPVPEQELSLVLEDESIRVFASPVKHLIPTLGLRFEFIARGRVVSYSCDTEPSEAVCRLAAGADILIHEATGNSVGHTSPAQAGDVARQAGVRHLYLIHYPPQLTTNEKLLSQAAQKFDGEITVAKDFLTIPIE